MNGRVQQRVPAAVRTIARGHTAPHSRPRIPGFEGVLAEWQPRTQPGDGGLERACPRRTFAGTPPPAHTPAARGAALPTRPKRYRRRSQALNQACRYQAGTMAAPAHSHPAWPPRGAGPPPAAAPGTGGHRLYRSSRVRLLVHLQIRRSRARAVSVADGFLNGDGHKLQCSYPNHQTCNFHR
jgi:hypothetical protein